MRSDKKKLVPTHTTLTPRRHAIVRPVGAHNAAGMMIVNNFLGAVVVAGGDVHQCAIGENCAAIGGNTGDINLQGAMAPCQRCAEKDRTIATLTETIHSLTKAIAAMAMKEVEP